MYSDDAAQVARNASVVVKRTPGLKPNTLQAGGSAAAPQPAAAAAAAPAVDQPAGDADAQPAAKDAGDAAFGDLYSEQPLPEAVPADDMQALLQQATDSWQKEMADSARAAFGRGRGGRFGGRGDGGRFGPGGRGACSSPQPCNTCVRPRKEVLGDVVGVTCKVKVGWEFCGNHMQVLRACVHQAGSHHSLQSFVAVQNPREAR